MDKQRILIVDDNEINRQILSDSLCDTYDLIEASNGIEALEKIKLNLSSLSLILLDIMMPELDGIGVLKALKRDVSSLTVPIIFITAAESNEQNGLQLGAVDFITKPFDPDIVRARVDTHIKLKNYRDQLEALIAYNISSNDGIWDSAFETLSSVCEYRNAESVSSTKAIKDMTELMFNKIISSEGKELMYFEDDINLFKRAAMTLDIGKIRISEEILLKPGKLTDSEFEQMKKHTVYGAEIVRNFSDETNEKYVSYCAEICEYHHEKWDGTGYPKGLSLNQIPYHVKAISLIHVYNALVSDRPYRKALSLDKAFEIIENESGKYFDPELVEIFSNNREEFEAIVKRC